MGQNSTIFTNFSCNGRNSLRSVPPAATHLGGGGLGFPGGVRTLLVPSQPWGPPGQPPAGFQQRPPRPPPQVQKENTKLKRLSLALPPGTGAGDVAGEGDPSPDPTQEELKGEFLPLFPHEFR